MKEFIRFSLPTGHVFELNARVVADDRAETMFKSHPEEFKTLDEAREDTMGLFDNDFDVFEWLLNNMDVDKLMLKHGRMVGFKAPALAWDKAERTMHDKRATVEAVTGENVMSMPVEMIVSAMAAGGTMCAAELVMNAATGKPQAAIAFIHGGEDVISAYVNGLQVITNHVVQGLQQQADAAAAAGATN